MLRLYFKQIKFEGLENLPKDKALLVTPNHQNAFLDPVLVGSFMSRPLHFLTRSDVFSKLTSPIFRELNMMPIYRIRDGFSKLSLNDAVFETCKELFNEKKSVLIFAEGNHGEHHYLRPLTKGAARIALKSQNEMEDELMIQPVGVNFFDHQAPRSTVLIVFGKPISVREYQGQYKKNEVKGLLAMREAISDGMKSTLVIPEATEDYEARKRTIFQEKNAHLSFTELRELKQQAQSLTQKKKGKHLIAKLLNPLPYYLLQRKLAKTKDIVFYSTIKFTLGIFLFPAWWLLVFTIMALIVGVPIATLTVLVMILGLFYSYQS